MRKDQACRSSFWISSVWNIKIRSQLQAFCRSQARTFCCCCWGELLPNWPYLTSLLKIRLRLSTRSTCLHHFSSPLVDFSNRTPVAEQWSEPNGTWNVPSYLKDVERFKHVFLSLWVWLTTQHSLVELSLMRLCAFFEYEFYRAPKEHGVGISLSSTSPRAISFVR